MSGTAVTETGWIDDLALRLQGFARRQRVVHAFSTRHGGLPYGDQDTDVWPSFLQAAGFPADGPLIRLRQVHGSRVESIRRRQQAAHRPLADAAVTSLPGVVLSLRTADCVPVLLAEPAAPTVAVAHAGWRGLVAGVIHKTVAAMVAAGAVPQRIQAALGPGIGPCCFQVGEEVATPFAALDAALVRRRDGRPYVDLQSAVAGRLLDCGVPATSIHRCALCTCCRQDLFFSHRGEQGRAGRLLAAVALAA